MKARFTLFQRGGIYYSQDTATGKQHSLRTKDESEALALLHSKNEAHRQPNLNLQIARTYLTATDPEVAKRTWQAVMDEMTKTKTGSVQRSRDISGRWQTVRSISFALCQSSKRMPHTF